MVVESREAKPVTPLPDYYKPLQDRSIKQETAEKYGIFRVGDKTYFANYKDGKHVGNKVRVTDKKELQWHEGTDHVDLFGAHLFPPGCAKTLTITEGEYDAPSAYEMMGSRWPAVSVINGTGSAVRDAKANYEYINSFENVVLSFDNDEPGKKAALEVAALFDPGKVRILHHRLHKDANDYLKARQHQEYTKEWWQAPKYQPDGLKLGSNMWDEIINRPNHFTTQYPFHGLNKLTYGLRLSEMVVITAETKIGKTSILKELEYKLLMDEDIKEKGYGVGFLHLEEPNYDTALGLLSIHNNKPYHLPDTERTEDELRAAYDDVINNNRVVIWDHFGSNTVEAVLDKVKHMHALGCKYIVLDHLSIVVSDQSGDERKQLDEITTKLKTLCMQLNIALICVIHQNRQGQIRGTAGVEQLANIVIKLHRDKLDKDPWRRNVTTVVVENNRFCGRTGPACYLWYNEMTGRMTELNEDEVKRFEEGGTLRDDERNF
jgi:twinkle protein